MNIDKTKIYEAAAKEWGEKQQRIAAAEEFAEAAAVLARYHNGKCHMDEVISELADAEIVSEQMRLYFSPQAIDEEKERKLLRLAEKLKIR
jgi:hypothetical protein